MPKENNLVLVNVILRLCSHGEMCDFSCAAFNFEFNTDEWRRELCVFSLSFFCHYFLRLRAQHWHDYTSPQVQNDILKLSWNTAVRSIAWSIRSLPAVQCSLIVDSTSDISGIERESVRLRYVDHELVPQLVYIGLHSVSGTTGEEIARVAVDVLLRLNLLMFGLRGQTYDGAANMSWAQAVVKRQQLLALYVHYGAHCLNLITQSTCRARPFKRWCLAVGPWDGDIKQTVRKTQGHICRNSSR